MEEEGGGRREGSNSAHIHDVDAQDGAGEPPSKRQRTGPGQGDHLREGHATGGGGGAVQERVRSHYNARPNTSVEERVRSPIYHLRNFNNWIKSALIADFTPPRATVLDLCAGKGGDLPKWCKAQLRYWVAAGRARPSTRG